MISLTIVYEMVKIQRPLKKKGNKENCQKILQEKENNGGVI